MDKISHQQVQALLKQAGASIRTLTQKYSGALKKVAEFEREDRMRKIAAEMETKHLNADLTYEEKLAQLRTAKDLNVTEEAVKLASPQGIKLGESVDGEGNGGSDAKGALETFIFQGDAPE